MLHHITVQIPKDWMLLIPIGLFNVVMLLMLIIPTAIPQTRFVPMKTNDTEHPPTTMVRKKFSYVRTYVLHVHVVVDPGGGGGGGGRALNLPSSKSLSVLA